MSSTMRLDQPFRVRPEVTISIGTGRPTSSLRATFVVKVNYLLQR